MKRVFIFLPLILFSFFSKAQSCTQILNQAEDFFVLGKLLEIESLISNCITNEGFSEEEEIRARKLLTKVAIFTDRDSVAAAELIALYNLDPTHELQPEDPNELKILVNKFRTWPIFRLEYRLGGNLTIPTVEKKYSAFSGSGSEKNYQTGLNIGFQLEVDITRHLFWGIETGLGFQFRYSSYGVNSTPQNGDGFQTTIVNTQSALRFPVFLRYNFNYFNHKNYMPYIYVGYCLDYYLAATYSQASRSGGTAYTLSGNDANLKPFNQINEINSTIFSGFGVKFKLKKGNFWFAELHYDKSLNLYNVPKERYSNDRLVSDLQFVEDDLYIDVLTLNFGYVMSIYKPKKIK